MRIGYLGAGAWGYCLANMLAERGHEVKLWTGSLNLDEVLKRTKSRPRLPSHATEENLVLTIELKEAITDVDMVVESVTSKGLRPVLEQILELGVKIPSFVITSKGIEQNSGLLLSEVVADVLGDSFKEKIGCISGPSLADEVTRKLPTSVVCSAYSPKLMSRIQQVFSTPYFRIYPNSDILGISFGGAMKNIIAIACAISDGLGFGENTKAALMTRGLHEIRKLSVVKGCNPETLNGLAGFGDLAATCLSTSSRNYKFGKFLAEGFTPDEAREKIGMVVEGAYTCLSALQLSQNAGIQLPITEVVYAIIYEGLDPKEAVETLLLRTVKQEHL